MQGAGATWRAERSCLAPRQVAEMPYDPYREPWGSSQGDETKSEQLEEVEVKSEEEEVEVEVSVEEAQARLFRKPGRL